MKIAQVAPLFVRVPPHRYGGTDRVVQALTEALVERTERARTVSLVFSTDSDRYVVAASNGGSPKTPHWFHNLTANPTVCVEIRDQWIEAKASVAQGSERDRLFNLHTVRLPELPEYQVKSEREIPIVILEPSPRSEA